MAFSLWVLLPTSYQISASPHQKATGKFFCMAGVISLWKKISGSAYCVPENKFWR